MAFRGKRGGKASTKGPEGKVRRSQVVGMYGPGAPIDLLHQAVLVGGLDFWSYGTTRGDHVISEPRLRDALAEQLQRVGRQLSVDGAFRAAPSGDERDPTPGRGIQVLEFPTWFVCQSPTCRALERVTGLQRDKDRYVHACPDRKTAECVPVRFVAACKRGHLEDFPWVAFAHSGRAGGQCASPRLRLDEGSTGDFSEIKVRCVACRHTPQNLSVAMSPTFRMECSGHRPWLGIEGRESCDQLIRLLVRTASNSYFGQLVSALSIPEVGHELPDKVSECWDVLSAATSATLSAFRTIPKVKAALDAYTDEQVLAAVEARRHGKPMPREPLRTAEFRTFMDCSDESAGDLPPPDADFHARRVAPEHGLPDGAAAVIVAHKLREVRAQIGFTRLESHSPDLQGEYDLGVTTAQLGLTTDWLPATEVRGEGVLLQLDEEAVQAWEARPEVQVREEQLISGFQHWSAGMDTPPLFPGARFYLLHSLAHMLITAISLECGYSASAIRERIYCAPAHDDLPMAAILLSTGSTGTEGTLGGLVEQGRKLRAHLRRAWDLAVLCSNDPVCAAHSPAEDLAERYLEGAACHGCLFVAECSCERFNRYLDRALVVPTLGHPAQLAFFGERP